MTIAVDLGRKATKQTKLNIVDLTLSYFLGCFYLTKTFVARFRLNTVLAMLLLFHTAYLCLSVEETFC